MRSRTPLPAVLAVMMGGVCVADAGAQQFGMSASALHRADSTMVRASRQAGRLEGLVTDERGTPLAGVAVTAQGAQLLFAVTDQRGRYLFDSLPPGPYFVRAHLPGFAASSREIVDVAAARASVQPFLLSRLGDASALMRPVMTASVAGGATAGTDAGEQDESAATEPGEHEHSATAWRLRHLKRSVLRDAGQEALGPEDTAEPTEQPSFADVSTNLSFWNALPFTGQVQLLTTSAFDSAGELFVGDRMPHGVAYVSLASPVRSSRMWTVQGAIAEGDVSSWIFGSSYSTTIALRHTVDVGTSYAAQRYNGANQLALAAMGDTGRTVGALHAFDRWAIATSMDLTVGGRYARYGYLQDGGLFSPSIEWRWTPGNGPALRVLVAQQMLAPGAEEFVPSPVAGLWIPPQRTFSPLNPSAGFRAERTRHVELGVERELGTFVLAARGYRQLVDNQIVTIFGLTTPGRARGDLGHYHTATAGDVEAFGWGVSLSRPVSSRLRGSVAYTLTHANWLSSPEVVLFGRIARSAARPPSERIQDVTTTLQTDIPETATSVYAVYKLDTGFTRGDNLEPTPAFAGRFDVQVSQRLPFVPLGDSEWEVLVAVRNLFRDPLDSSSVYDELLVVRPPKRIVGGLTVRF